MPKIEHIEFYSHILNRNLKVEITGHWGYPILMFPTSGGSYTQNHDFHLNASIQHYTDNGILKLYNVETIDMESFYAKWMPPHDRMYNYNQYMRFLEEEFIPYIQRENNTHRIATAGCSFGGYHASNVAFRNPDLFSHLFSLSGAFTIRSFMDGYSDEKVYFNCPEEYLPNDDAWRFQHMNIVLSTSDQDILKPDNLNMSKILNDKGIDHWYDEKKWINHDWPLWRMTFPEYIAAYF